MQVQVETLPNCVAALHVELPPERVDKERDSIVRDYQGAARLPGYRPGKAPRGIVEARYKKEINEELQRKLIGAATREAIAEQKLRVLQVSDVEQVHLGQDRSLSFTAKVITAPEFELPTYQGLTVRVPPAEITDENVDAALESLRQRLADFSDITDRPLAMDDFCILDFAGRVDGQPVNEAFPTVPKELAGKEGFWIKLGPETLLPGFSDALVGAAAGETRDFSLNVPDDFPLEELKGKKLDYTVKVREIKKQELPALDDEFAGKVVPGKTLAELRDMARAQLTSERATQIEEGKRQQILAQLSGGTTFDLPADFVRGETRRIMGDIVKQNQDRGVADTEIRDNETTIVENAGVAARERLKGAFILTRIAEKEGIKVTREEMEGRLQAMAARYGMTREKLVKNLQEREAFGQVEEELLLGKTLAFLSQNATVETVALSEAEAPADETATPTETLSE